MVVRYDTVYASGKLVGNSREFGVVVYREFLMGLDRKGFTGMCDLRQESGRGSGDMQPVIGPADSWK